MDDVYLPSVSWTGRASGAASNWDGNYHYYDINVKLNVGNGILSYSNSKLTGLIAHELGHAVGLEHRTTSNGGGRDFLMYPYDSRYQYTPNSTEDATLYNLYYHQL
ncbi:hypothetical protein N784_11590 [Pontibacillus litoralis JSM 072002]|uniref:Peptidase M10 metallopeptidase domain-containing protein n=1 Tax=Pontibacillus litoralis JSM 072002 TaxID=1385512 RepID=A0A0A5FYN5_9BACI|nr:hypothetical protein N784_11590 [Pontibacillus litoralis JSM 072002]